MLDSLLNGFSYDDRGQLTEACFGACPGQAAVPQLPCLACVGSPLARPAASTTPVAADKFIRFIYDAVGNRLSEATHLGNSTSAYDAGDRLASVTAPGGAVTNYTYDANGNQTAAGARTYTYDAADRMTTARVGTTTETYTWSGDGLRLSASTGTTAAKTTRYVWDRNFGLAQLAIERNGSGTTLRSYTYALDLLSQTAGTSTYYYHHDGLGSVGDVTGSTGTSLAWNEYQPFGALRRSGASTKAPTNLFRFTGEYLDTFTGLYHLRARQYDPGLGRFLTTDAMTPEVSQPYVGSYVYVRNGPTLFTDPAGTCIPAAVPVAAVAGGGVMSWATAGGALLCIGAVWLIGSVLIQQPVIEGLSESRREHRPPYPESRPQVTQDPNAGRTRAELERIGQGGSGEFPAPHGGLSPRGFCGRHQALCVAGALAGIGAFLTGLILGTPGIVGASTGGQSGSVRK